VSQGEQGQQAPALSRVIRHSRNASIGNPGETGVGPPIKTFGVTPLGQLLSLCSDTRQRCGAVHFDIAAQKMMECMAMMDGMGMMGIMIWGLLSMLLGLVILFLFILSAAYGVKWVWGQTQLSTTGHGESALDILKKRYARGEISREEFERVKREIE
jgi:putative membrane protein